MGARELKSVTIRLARFGSAGLVALGIQIGLFWVLLTKLSVAPLLAGGFAALLATFISFLINSHYTWRDQRPSAVRSPLWRMGRFYIVIGTGYLVYLAVFRELLMLQTLPFWGNLLGALASGASNFLIHSLWTFRRG